jgi:hypothetical protein
MRKTAGGDAGTRWTAHRGGAIRLLKAGSRGGESIHVRGVDEGIAGAGQGSRRELVEE